jgi:diguanylate cyclase (GGDEF)-like protein/PAS domain S-box-containing protein
MRIYIHQSSGSVKATSSKTPFLREVDEDMRSGGVGCAEGIARTAVPFRVRSYLTVLLSTVLATAAVVGVCQTRHPSADAIRSEEVTRVCGLALLLAGGAFVLSRQRRQAAQSSALLRSVIESITQPVVAMSANRSIILANGAAKRMFDGLVDGHPVSEELLTALSASSEEGQRLRPDDNVLRKALRGERTDSATFFIQREGQADATWLSGTSRPVHDRAGNITCAVAVFRDITQERRQTAELRIQSIRDELTQLYNRRGFMLRAGEHERRSSVTNKPFSVAFFDLNGLKRVNDTLGHEAGDQMIRDAATLLGSSLGTDIVARLGGDEFVAVIAGDEAAWARSQRRLADAMVDHNAKTARERRVSLSVGRATSDSKAPRSIPELVREADRAMYVNKKQFRRHSSPLRLVPRDAVAPVPGKDACVSRTSDVQISRQA